MSPTRGRRSGPTATRRAVAAASAGTTRPMRLAGVGNAVRGSRIVLTTWFVVSVVAVVAFAALLLLMARDEVRLDVHHERARATVVRTFDGGRGAGRALVRFAVAGRPVEAEVGLSWFGDTPRAGSRLAVEYDPGHPARARRAGSHDVVGIAVPLAAVVVLAVAGWRPWRRRRW